RRVEDLAQSLTDLPLLLDDQDQDVALRLLALPVGLLVLAVLDEELTTLQCALNGDKQLVNVRGLQEVGVRAALQALDIPRSAGSAGQHDHGHIAVEGADLAEKLDPV